MNTIQSSSFRSTTRFAFWWLLAHLAETAIGIRSTLTGVVLSAHTGPIAGVESSGGVTQPSENPIQAAASPGPFMDRSPLATGHSPLLVGHSQLATGHLSLKPLALAGLAAYVMGIAVVLIIRAQIV